MKLTIVIPMYNEEKIVADTARQTEAFLSENFPDSEAVFVNDGSTDGTAAAFEAVLHDCPHLRLAGYEKNRGKGCAVRTGMLEGRGDIIAFTDCDLAYGLDVIKEFAERNASCDVCIGSRALHPGGYEGYSPLRKLMSKVYLLVIRLAAGFPWSDSQSGIKSFTNAAAKKIFGDARCVTDGFAFDLEALMLARSFGMSVTEIPVKIINHRASHINPVRDTLRMLRQLRSIKKRIGKKEKQ